MAPPEHRSLIPCADDQLVGTDLPEDFALASSARFAMAAVSKYRVAGSVAPSRKEISALVCIEKNSSENSNPIRSIGLVRYQKATPTPAANETSATRSPPSATEADVFIRGLT